MGQRGKIGERAGTHSKSTNRNLIKIDGRLYYANQLAWFYMTGEWADLVDHENRDKADDRWGNLRKATRPQNMANSPIKKNNSTGAKGVVFIGNKRKPFRSRIVINNKRVLIGDFATLEEAKLAYASKSIEHFGEFSCV